MILSSFRHGRLDPCRGCKSHILFLNEFVSKMPNLAFSLPSQSD